MVEGMLGIRKNELNRFKDILRGYIWKMQDLDAQM